jgi:hypothetical protein
MTIREKENIFIGRIHIERWVMFHDFEIQGRKKFGASEGAAWVSAAAAVYHSNDIPAYLGRNCLKFSHKN